MEEGISIIICCFNSSSRLKPTLEHLYNQKNLSPDIWEIILVDNASTDGTAKTAKEIWNSFPKLKPTFKVVTEEKAGLSNARNKGIQEAKFKFVLFCDDDNWLNEDYADIALKTMLANPSIGALGGKGSPAFEGHEPPYFWQTQYHMLAVGSQWETDGDITEHRGVLYGAGLVLNKSAYKVLLEQYNFQFQVTDRIGNSLTSSGDHELCLALKEIGYKIYYLSSLGFEHFIPVNRTTIKYYKNLFLSFGEADAILHVYFVKKSELNNIKNDYRYICLRCTKNIILTWLYLVCSGYYLRSDRYVFINKLHHMYNNVGIFKRKLILRNSFKKVFSENNIFSNK